MLNRAAEESFDKGIEALGDIRWKEALAYFEGAVALERRFGRGQPQARYLSFLGLSLAFAKQQYREAVRLCSAATQLERFNPDLLWNLGRVQFAAGNRRQAFSALVRGLRQEPQHTGLRRDLRRMGVRKRPVLPFLSRQNPLNVALGRRRVV